MRRATARGSRGVDATVDRLLALRDALLGRANLLQALLVFRLRFLAKAQRLVLGLDGGFPSKRLSLALSIVHHGFRLLGGSLRGSVCKVLGDDEAKGDADDGADHEPDDDIHELPFRSFVYFIRFSCSMAKRNPA